MAGWLCLGNLLSLPRCSLRFRLIGAGLLSLGSTAIAHAQATPRITGEVEQLGAGVASRAVHPWARPEFDRGVAPENLSGRMLLVLKRSPEQESALQALLASQQDPNSPNYHKWLTPEDFGKRFGVADSDVQTVTSYLSSQGMSVGRVYGGHMAIEVGATAGTDPLGLPDRDPRLLRCGQDLLREQLRSKDSFRAAHRRLRRSPR